MCAKVWQHFVPQVYLKQFSARPKNELCRFDGEKLDSKSVRSQCAEDYFYSSTDPVFFEKMENAYGRIVKTLNRSVLSQKPQARPRDFLLGSKNKKDDLVLILMMCDLHCRNPAYTNLIGRDNVDSYQALVHCLRKLLTNDCHFLTDEELFHHFVNFWQVKLLHLSSDLELITSDNPALWFTLDQTENMQRLQFMILPITSDCCAVGWNRRLVQVAGHELTRDDAIRLNCNQIQHCTNFVYSRSRPSSDEIAALRIAWKRRERPCGQVTANYCDFNLLQIIVNSGFSFLSRLP